MNKSAKMKLTKRVEKWMARFKKTISSSSSSSSKKPLIKNSDPTDEHSLDSLVFDSTTTQSINCDQERKDQSDEKDVLQDLHTLLDVSSEDDSHASDCPDQTPGQRNLKRYIIPMNSFWAKHFPKPPSDQDQEGSLVLHLSEVSNVVNFQLERLKPALQRWGLMGLMIQCCHRQTFDHMETLLRRVNSCRNHFVMMNWVRSGYLSYKPLSCPDPRMFNEWETKAKDKLLKNVQSEIKMQLQNTLKLRNREHSNSEEDYIGFYVDIIQCAEAMPVEARKISPDLSSQVRDICLQELLIIVKRYAAEEKAILDKIAQSNKLETIHYLKTLKTCKEIRNYIQTKGTGIQTSLRQETVETLEKLEDFTSKLLTGIVTAGAESTFKRYFKSHDRTFSPFADVEKHFPKLSYVSDEHKTVMDDIYKAIAHVYFKTLLGTKLRKLRKSWRAEVERTVAEDARQLHDIFSNLVPDIQQWNRLLLEIPEVLTSQSPEVLKLTMASVQMDCKGQSDDLELLPDLLRWKGLSKRNVRDVMEALPDTPPDYRFKSRSIFSCVFLWCF